MTKAEKALSRAESEHYKIRESRAERKDELWRQVDDLESKLDGQLAAEFSAKEAEALAAVNAAQSVVDQERIAKANAATGRFAVGTKCFRWNRIQWTEQWQKGECGIVEVFTAESPLRATASSYSRPRIGSLVIRHMRVDGTPALRISESNFEGNFHGWLPDGEEPKGKS